MVPLTPEERSRLLLEISNAEKKLTQTGGRLFFDEKIPNHPFVAGDREGMMRLGLAALRFALEADPPSPRGDGRPVLDFRDVRESLSGGNAFTSFGLVVYPDDDFPDFFKSPLDELKFSLRRVLGLRKRPK